VALISIGGALLTLASIMIFVKVEKPVNKAFTLLAWGVWTFDLPALIAA